MSRLPAQPESPPAPPPGEGVPDLRAITGGLVRDLIRNDPELWARVQADSELRRQFGFDDAVADS
jgi:hypothetical protein